MSPALAAGNRPLPAVAFGIIGVGLGGAFSPLLSVGLAHAAPEDAPDLSGLFVMTTQLGQVVGIATFGTLYLSSGSVTATGLALTGTILVTGACALPLLRRR